MSLTSKHTKALLRAPLLIPEWKILALHLIPLRVKHNSHFTTGKTSWTHTRASLPKKWSSHTPETKRLLLKAASEAVQAILRSPEKIKLPVTSSGASSSKQNGAHVWQGDRPLLSSLFQIFSRQAISSHSVARRIKITTKLNRLMEQLNCTTVF